MNGAVVWFTGRPSSGKTTLACAVRDRLIAMRKPVCVLDGDDVRATLVPPPGYTPTEREDFYSTLAGLAALLAHQGLIVLVAATAHRRAFRALARSRSPRYVEVYVAASREECECRDVKHLYADAAAGRITGLPGVDVTFEAPDSPDVIATGGLDADAVGAVIDALQGTGGGIQWHKHTSQHVSEF